jgi:hypothetical protein
MLQQLQRFALTRAFRRGGNRTWLIAGTAVWLLRKANSIRKPDAETIYRGVLEPGHQVVIEHLPVDQTGSPRTREAKRAAKLAAKRR